MWNMLKHKRTLFYVRYTSPWLRHHRPFLITIGLVCYINDSETSVFPLRRFHDDVIKWKYFPRYWLFVRGIHRSPVNSPKVQWRGALMFSLIWPWINDWVNNREAGDLRHHRANYDVIVMSVIGKTSRCHHGIMHNISFYQQFCICHAHVIRMPRICQRADIQYTDKMPHVA